MKLVEEWRSWWRLWSVRISAVATIIWAYLLASPDVMLSVLNSLPPELRDVLPPAAPVAIFALVTIARLIKQGPKNGE